MRKLQDAAYRRCSRAVRSLAAAAAILVCASATAHASQQGKSIAIDQIEVLGVTVLPPESVESSIEIGIGDALEQAKIVRSAENLRTQYRALGYEQVSIQARLVRRKGQNGRFLDVLEIAIQEGKPSRIAEVRFVPVSDAVSYAGWKRISTLLEEKNPLLAGDLYNQDRLSEARRIFQEVLAAEKYVGSRLDQVNVTEVPAPANTRLGAEDLARTGRWLRLDVRVQLGERVSFGFRGNSALSATKLTALVDEQRALGLGRDYISAIRTRIEDEYRSLGFARVNIETLTFEPSTKGVPDDERHVTFVIHEGPRVTIDSVTFDGNTVFSSAELREKFFDLAPALVQRDYYVEKDVRKAAELVIEWIRSKGYLGAKLVTINTNYVPKVLPSEQFSSVKLVIYIYESDQTILQRLDLKGVTILDRSEVERILGVHEGEPLNLFAFSEGIEALKAAYRARGHLDMTVLNEGTDKVVSYIEENRFANILLQVNEGPQFRVSAIEIEGRMQTQEKVITREMALKVGDVVEEPRLSESEANLRRLGIFSSVKVRALPDPEKADGRIIRVNVDEAPPGIVAGGPGFRNDLGVRGFAEVGYTNLWGLNHSIFFDAAANRRVDNTFRFGEYQMQVAYNWPWFAGNDLVFRPTINLSGTQYTNFDAVTTSVALNWQKRLIRRPNLTGLFTYSLEHVNQFNAASVVDDGIFRIGAITPALRLDLRDNPLAPTSGLFSQVSFELADPLLLSQRAPSPIGYTRFQFRADYVIPVARDISWLISFRNGFERSTQSRAGDNKYGAIPLIKQFALGGIGSLRGFSEQELNVRDINVLGTLSYVNYRTQIDFPIAGALKFGPFLDAANLQVDTFSFGNLRYGTGFGFRYITPLGPVNLDYGFKIDPRPNESPSEFYFSIGVI